MNRCVWLFENQLKQAILILCLLLVLLDLGTMASVGKRSFVIADIKAIAAKYGMTVEDTKQSLIDNISNAIAVAHGEETSYTYFE